jgi:hypothetical protein
LAQQQAELERHTMRRVYQLQQQGVPFLEELVGGRSIAEIDASVQFAQDEYKRLQAKMEAEFRRKYNLSEQGLPLNAPSIGVPVGSLPANPAFMPPGQPGQMPTPVNPQTVTEQVDPMAGVFGGGVEQAVRSGAWGQLREHQMAHLRGTMGPGMPLGNQPRHMTQPQGYVPQPPAYAMPPAPPPPYQYGSPGQPPPAYAPVPLAYQPPRPPPQGVPQPPYMPPVAPPQVPQFQHVPFQQVWNGYAYEWRPVSPPAPMMPAAPYGYPGGPQQNPT